MTTAASLRDARLSDIPAITAIYRESVLNGTATYELDPPDEAEMTKRFDSLAGYPFITAERDGTVVGYAYAGPFRPRPAYRFIVEDSIYIAPEGRGAGLGRLLLGDLLRRSEALGFRQMVAVIGDGHEGSASVALHRALGFSWSGVMKGSGYKHGRWLDTVLMQYQLNGGDATPPDAGSFPERRFRGLA